MLYLAADVKTLAILVPYRNRKKNLSEWLSAISRYPQLRQLKPTIHIIAQSNRLMFNRGRLLNIGFLLAPKSDYYCFHDVDLLPISADYSFSQTPSHLSSRCSQYNYQVPYEGLFGGVSCINFSHFQTINGYSNQYFDWGGEDDDLLLRCQRAGLVINWRDGIFYSMKHQLNYDGKKPHHKNNIDRLKRFHESSLQKEVTDGLSDVTFIELVRESIGDHLDLPITMHHVSFNNRDLEHNKNNSKLYLRPKCVIEVNASENEIHPQDISTGGSEKVNEQAATVLSLCNGRNSIDDLIHRFSEHFMDSIFDIEGDIPEFLAILETQGFVEMKSPFATEFVLEPYNSFKKTITITVNDRPECLSQLLNSLSKNNTKDYSLVFSIEPGNDDVREMCENFDFPAKTILYNPVKLGVRSNPYSVLDYVFSLGASGNLYLEDDLELAVDALDLVNWFWDNNNYENVAALSLHSNRQTIDFKHLDKISRFGRFSSLGMALSRERWERFFKFQWFNNNHSLKNKGLGWDYSINAYFKEHGLRMMEPYVSRSRHTGRYGTHCTPEIHDKVLGKVRVDHFERVTKFSIVKQ